MRVNRESMTAIKYWLITYGTEWLCAHTAYGLLPNDLTQDNVGLYRYGLVEDKETPVGVSYQRHFRLTQLALDLIAQEANDGTE
jgi:hypothetical protein